MPYNVWDAAVAWQGLKKGIVELADLIVVNKVPIFGTLAAFQYPESISRAFISSSYSIISSPSSTALKSIISSLNGIISTLKSIISTLKRASSVP